MSNLLLYGLIIYLSVLFIANQLSLICRKDVLEMWVFKPKFLGSALLWEGYFSLQLLIYLHTQSSVFWYLK